MRYLCVSFYLKLVSLTCFHAVSYFQDSRLLGEIHVALLKTLVRDIEEAAQAVSGGMVGQRDAIAMAAGGHPQLVEAVS